MLTYGVIKALHIIGFTCWFAGLFYVVRLFIYNTETSAQPDETTKAMVQKFNLMQRRLWYGITWPAMIATLVFGVWLLVLYGEFAPWLHLKLGVIGLLCIYHLLLGRIHRGLVAKTSTWTSRSLRILNEGAILFLIAIVFIAVLKDGLTLKVAMSISGVFLGLLVVGFLAYQKVRTK